MLVKTLLVAVGSLVGLGSGFVLGVWITATAVTDRAKKRGMMPQLMRIVMQETRPALCTYVGCPADSVSFERCAKHQR
jgi:F0F1-type ATP synthase membrane subunit c/vacuolar-type H+-ATPase subunit K